MSNVVALREWVRERVPNNARNNLIECFAEFRRSENDVFWLKENAELLNIIECSLGASAEYDLSSYDTFYEGIDRRICFFRQYYRFYLSICMDLEDLGMPGQKGEALAQWVRQQNLAEAELSDLQRAEAQRLMGRRNAERQDEGLPDRLRAFMRGSARFALPNTKTAYELTHIVFYLSEYGRKDPDLPPEALDSLRNVGVLAFMDQNMDLLAEVCISLRYANADVPASWETALAASLQHYRFVSGGFDGSHDDYHAYFVGTWWSMTAGREGFSDNLPGGGMAIRAAQTPGVMKPLSHLIFNDENLGRLPWSSARARVMAALPSQESALLSEAESSVPEFEQFYEHFARAGRAQ